MKNRSFPDLLSLIYRRREEKVVNLWSMRFCVQADCVDLKLCVSIGMMISFVIVILSNSLEKYYNLFLFLRRVQFLSLGWTQMRRSRSNLNERDRIISFAAERGLKGCKLTLFTCINRSSLIAPCYASVNTTWIVELQNTTFEWRGGKKKRKKDNLLIHIDLNFASSSVIHRSIFFKRWIIAIRALKNR